MTSTLRRRGWRPGWPLSSLLGTLSHRKGCGMEGAKGRIGDMSTLTRSAAVRSMASVAGALLVLMVGVSPAGAATPAKKTPKSPLAGYLVTAAVTSVEATVSLPSFTCKSKTDAVATEEAVLDASVSQTSGALIGLVCSSKKVALYGAELQIDG